MRVLLAAALVVPLALVAQLAPGHFEPGEHRLPVASWTTVGADAARSFRVATPGSTSTYHYSPWRLANSVYAPTEESLFYGAVTGDLDGDGREEIVAASTPFGFDNPQARLHVWSASGDLLWSLNLSGPSAHPVLVDWNGDGRLEVQVTHGLLFQVFDGNGSLLWSAPLPEPWPCGIHCSHAVGYDLTADGVPDILMDGREPVTTEPRGPPVAFAVDGRTGSLLWRYATPCGIDLAPSAVLPTNAGPLVLVGCRTFDGNLTVRTGATLFALHPRGVLPAPGMVAQQAELSWKRDFSLEEPYHHKTGLLSLSTGDVTGDGPPEVIVSTVDPHSVVVLSAEGQELASWVDDAEPPEAYTGYYTALAELDGTPGLEIIEGRSDETMAAYDILGAQFRVLWSKQLEGAATAFAVADFDGDGLDEFVVPLQIGPACQRDKNGEVLLLNADGATLWSSGPTPKCVQPIRGLAVADLNKDGSFEIIVPAAQQFLVYGMGLQPESERSRR